MENQPEIEIKSDSTPAITTKVDPILPSKEQSNFSANYQELRNRIGSILEREKSIITIASDTSGQVPATAESVPPTPENLSIQIEKLESEKSVDPIDYLKKSGPVVNYSHLVSVGYNAQLQELDNQEELGRHQSSAINQKLVEIESKSAVKQFFLFPETKRLRSKKEKLGQNIQLLKSQKLAVEKKRDDVSVIVKPIFKKRQEAVLEETKRCLTEIRAEHVAFINKSLNDQQLLGEISEGYITEFINPALDRTSANDAEKEEFRQVLKSNFDISEKPPEEQRALRDKLHNLTDYSNKLCDMRYTTAARNLLAGGTSDPCPFFLRSLLNDVAAQDFSEATTIFETQEQVGINQGELMRMAREIRETSEYDQNKRSINGSQIVEIQPENMAQSENAIEWYKAMQKSKIINPIFGNKLKEIDGKIHEICLDRSLTDHEGGYIDNLAYYPLPETVKYAVLLAAADQYSYRINHANCTLTRLAERTDWNQILDRAEEKYPNLKLARPLLEKWHLTEYYSDPNIRNLTGDFSLSLFQEGTSNPNLGFVLREALANHSMLDVLATKGFITKDEAEVIKVTQVKLRQLELAERNKEEKVNVSNYYLGEEVKKQCRPLMDGEKLPSQMRENYVSRLKHLGILSKEIANNKDLNVLSILTSDSVVGLVAGTHLSEEKTNLFIKSLAKLISEGTDSLDKSSDDILGEGFFQAADGEGHAINIMTGMIFKHLEQITDRLPEGAPTPEINDQNWQTLLSAYVMLQTEHVPGGRGFSQSSREMLLGTFQKDEVKNFCLDKLNSLWHDYLANGTPGVLPFSLSRVPEVISYCRGAGPLSQIESLGLFIKAINKINGQPTTVERTKIEIFSGVNQMEDRFVKEKWSNDDKADFYNISRDIITASPSVYTDFLNLFQRMTPAELKRFSKELYPLYRAKLVLIEQTNSETGIKIYTKEQLINLRKDIRNLGETFKTAEKPFEAQKEKLLGEIRQVFQERFGITKIPEDFTSEHMRAFTNFTMYLANLHDRKPEKEDILGFYLALTINKKWDDFRRGAEINPSEFLVLEKSQKIVNILAERQRNNPLTSENLGITTEDMPEFNRLLQQETQSITVGNIETIDVKLNNVIINLHELEDLDLYPNPLDKQRVKLLIDHGNKKVGSVVARVYQQLNNPSKEFQFDTEETEIKTQIENIITENKLNLSPEIIKMYFQDGLRPLATVANLHDFIETTGAEQDISFLRDLLQPNQKIIDVFNRLGEDFRPGSGAIALSQDLNYLDNLIVKREDEIQSDEKVLLTQYTSDIRKQVVKLQGVYDQIKNKFSAVEQSSSSIENPLLKDKLGQISKIINTEATQQTLVSTVSNDMNVIIENIRACLSCTREGCNNDTVLTFGDPNKFYLYSHSEAGKGGSLSDQILFVEPVTHKDGTKEISFVLDKVYGSNTPIILANQVEAVIKKREVLKQKFPNIKLSIFVTNTAISSSGLSPELLLGELNKKKITANIENDLEVDVAPSAAGDHYIEFEGGSRQSGKRSVAGVIIK